MVLQYSSTVPIPKHLSCKKYCRRFNYKLQLAERVLKSKGGWQEMAVMVG